MHKTVVVGTGFSGSILARKIAEELGRKVDVVEKRPHIGGNMYDCYDEHGILIQRYGPHFLNTDSYAVIKFLKQYGELFEHETKLLSFIDGKYVRLPFNFTTVRQLAGAEHAETLYAKFRRDFGGRDRVPVLELINSNDTDIAQYGAMLFDKAYRTYIAKQWGIPLEKIDRYVLDRVPMAMGYDERYLNKDFQYLPKNGFAQLFDTMLNHPNIRVSLGLDALEHVKFDENHIFWDGVELDCLVFTGQIDELFDFRYGSLPYRSLEFQYEHYSQDAKLPAEIVSYPQAEGYTRSTEYRKIMFDQSGCDGTVVVTEYPLEYISSAQSGNIPYYPVLTDESKEVYARYLKLAGRYKNLFLCGRLAEFRYYNMDICIEHALEYFDNIKVFLDGKSA
jgi:UDP-galactopyranose mutase